jgi:hypothetical protein
MAKIGIAKDFHPYPGGRFPRHGEGNGETFRKEFLLPYLTKGEPLEVVLDDASGFPASFLEEAFGGLIREGLSLETIKQLLTISVSDDENEVYREEAWQYVEDQSTRENP